MKTFCLVKAFRMEGGLQLSECSYHNLRADKIPFLCRDSALSEDFKKARFPRAPVFPGSA